jgi:hypothetical protein
VLVIDDLRVFEFDAVYARTSDDAIAILCGTLAWDEVWWDHDLGDAGGNDDVRPVLSFLEERLASDADARAAIGLHVIVTSNPAGERYLAAAFERWDQRFVHRSGQVPHRTVDTWANGHSTRTPELRSAPSDQAAVRA